MAGNKDLETNLRIWNVTTEGPLHVNATLLKAFYQSQHVSVECLFGGLTVLNQKNMKRVQLFSICDDEAHAVQHKSLVSTNSNLLIIALSYLPYSDASFTLSVSQTRCRSLVIDLCYFEKLSEEQNNLKFSLHAFLEKRKFPDIITVQNKIRPTFTIFAHANMCTALHFTQYTHHTNEYLLSPVCSAEVKFGTTIMTNDLLQVSIVGSVVHHTQARRQVSYAYFQGDVEQFFVKAFPSTHHHKNIPVHNMHQVKLTNMCFVSVNNRGLYFSRDCFVVETTKKTTHQGYSQYAKYMALAKIKTPVSTKSFSFGLRFDQFQHNNWMNVMVELDLKSRKIEKSVTHHTETLSFSDPEAAAKQIVDEVNQVLAVQMNKTHLSTDILKFEVCLLTVSQNDETHKLEWISATTLEDTKYVYFALPGNFRSASFKTNNKNHTTKTLRLLWVQDVFEPPIGHKSQTLESSVSLLAKFTCYSVPPRYRTYDVGRHFIFCEKTPQGKPITIDNPAVGTLCELDSYDYVKHRNVCSVMSKINTLHFFKHSWSTGSKLCTNIQSFLPVLQSKGDQNNIVSFVKLSLGTIYPFLEAIFIGLKANSSVQVNLLFVSFVMSDKPSVPFDEILLDFGP